jgi:hypothetical protein
MYVVLALLALFAAGLVAAWVVRRMLGSLTEPSALALIAAPFIIYGIASGAIAEFTGFGITAKFNKVAEIKVTELAGSLAIKSRIEDTNFGQAATFQECSNYFIIRDDLGKKSGEPAFLNFAFKVASAIKSAMLCGDFYGVVVVDKADRFLGLFQASRLAGLLAYPLDRYCIFDYKHCNEAVDIVNVLAETELGVILKDPDVRAQTAEATKYIVQETDSLADIVKSAEFSKASVFAVLDRHGKFIGLLPKQAIYDKILAVLLGPR